MSLKSLIIVVISAVLIAGPAFARTPSPDGAQVYIISPANEKALHSPVLVRFGLRGMGVAPAGIDKLNTGHHHLLVDVPGRPVLDKPLPADNNHKHFGGGQTEASIELSPGKHTLQLIMGDKNHIPHDPAILSEKITIIIK